ncbi:MAG: DUF4129 domain-containing protein [Prevotella sp.]|nr:DUF4129 domain-containing protein [Prevotella sp.]
MTDTLSVDTLRIAEWRTKPEFDYTVEFKGSSFSLWDWFTDRFNQIMQNLFSDISLGYTGEIIWYVLGFGAIVAIIVYTLYRHPELLRWRSKKNAENDGYIVEEDNIYGIDFPSTIDQALKVGNYREAVRLVYLQTLRHLSDAGKIDWQPAKTPSQYLNEYIGRPFHHLTTTFVRIRYGGYDADVSTADAAMADSKATIEEIEIAQKAETNATVQTMTTTKEKGGTE